MNITQILSFFDATTSEEQTDAFANARGKLQAVASALNAYESTRANAENANMRDQLDAIDEHVCASWSPLLQIQASLPFWCRTAFRHFRLATMDQLRELQKAIAGEESLKEAGPWKRHVASQLASLDEWEDRAARARWQRKLLTSVCLLVAAVVGPILVFFQFLHGDIQADSVSVIFPSGPYRQVSSKDHDRRSNTPPIYSAVPVDHELFMTEFSRFYFDRPNALGQRLFESPDEDQRGDQIHRWKVLLRNTSLRSTEYISSVSVTVGLLEARPFPWKDLTVTPNVEIDTWDEEVLLLENTGIAPAIGLSWTIEADSGEIIGTGGDWILDGRGFLNLTDGSKDWGICEIVDPNQLIQPTAKETAISGPHYFPALTEGVPSEAGGEQIDSLERLKTLTKVISPKNYTLLLEFEDVKGARTTLQHTGRLPSRFVWYEVTEEVGPDPGAQKGGDAAQKGGDASQKGGRAMAAFTRAFSIPLPSPEAVDQLIMSLDLNLSEFQVGHKQMFSKQVDALLSPSGHISLYTSAKGARTGLYEIRVDVNGDAVTHFLLETFVVPDSERFPLYRDFPSYREPERQWKVISDLRARIAGEKLRSSVKDHPLLRARSLEAEPELRTGPVYSASLQ